MTKTAVAAPAPRPSDEELLAAIEELSLTDLQRLALLLKLLIIQRRKEARSHPRGQTSA